LRHAFGQFIEFVVHGFSFCSFAGRSALNRAGNQSGIWIQALGTKMQMPPGCAP